MNITSARIALLAGVAWLALGGAAAAEPEARQAAQLGASPAGAVGELHVAQASSQTPQQGSAGEAAKPMTGEPTTSQPPQAEGQKTTGGAAQANPEMSAPAKQQTDQPAAQKPGKAAAMQACTSPVTVEKGDTLLSIARRCDTTLKAIVQANPDLQNPNLIHVGQKIRMPTG